MLSYFAKIISIIGGAKHALFFATPMLLIGDFIAKQRGAIKHSSFNRLTCIWILAILFTVSFCEATILKMLMGSQIRLDVSLFGWMPSIPLLLLGLNSKTIISSEMSRRLRKITDIVYIIHVWVIVIVKNFTRLEYVRAFLIVTVMSFAFACFCLILFHTICNVKKSV